MFGPFAYQPTRQGSGHSSRLCLFRGMRGKPCAPLPAAQSARANMIDQKVLCVGSPTREKKPLERWTFPMGKISHGHLGAEGSDQPPIGGAPKWCFSFFLQQSEL